MSLYRCTMASRKSSMKQQQDEKAALSLSSDSNNLFCFRSMPMAVAQNPMDSVQQYQHPPLAKQQDFGLSSSESPYYSRPTSGFVSGKEVLASTSSSPLIKEVIRRERDDPKPDIKPALLSAGCWAPDKLRRLGYYHPLEPCHVSFPRSELSATLDRLTDCFKLLSCRVLYEDDLLSAACLTMEQVEFQVSLYESRQDTQTVLLELQRRAGDSFTFHQEYAQPILAVAQGQALRAGQGQSFNNRNPALSLDRLAKHAGVTDEDVEVAIELASGLVNSDRLDACRLGMESLMALADSSKTGMSTARKVARELVMPTNANSEKLMHTMLKYLLSTDASSSTSDDLAFGALQVWSNVWKVAADDMETPLDSFCEIACDRESLMNCLMNRIENVRQEPHHATLALQGLAALCREMPHLRGSVSWHEVEKAMAVGEAENAALELASRKFLEAR